MKVFELYKGKFAPVGWKRVMKFKINKTKKILSVTCPECSQHLDLEPDGSIPAHPRRREFWGYNATEGDPQGLLIPVQAFLPCVAGGLIPIVHVEHQMLQATADAQWAKGFNKKRRKIAAAIAKKDNPKVLKVKAQISKKQKLREERIQAQRAADEKLKRKAERRAEKAAKRAAKKSKKP